MNPIQHVAEAADLLFVRSQQSQPPELPFAEVGANVWIFVGGQEVDNFIWQPGDKGDKLKDPASVDSDDFSGLGVGVDGFVLKKTEPLQALKNRIVPVSYALVMLPLPNRNPGYPGQFSRFSAPDIN